jgi:hypothetical protein
MSQYESDRTVGPTGAEVDEFVDAEQPEPAPPSGPAAGDVDDEEDGGEGP